MKALDQTFKKIDELIDSYEGGARLSEIRKTLRGSLEDLSQNNIGNGTGCTANVLLITP